MTPLVYRAIQAHRQYIRRSHGRHQPAAFIINPKDDTQLGVEFAWCRPQTEAVMPLPMEPCFKYIKGIPVYADPRVPLGHVAVLKHAAA